MRMKVPVAIASLLFLGTSCDLIDYHPYDGKTNGTKRVNEWNALKIHNICQTRDTVRFVFMGDTQRWYDETVSFVNHLNQRGDVDFVIHAGDISDFGMTNEFEWVHSIMNKLHVPYVALLGNHDVIGNGINIFRSIYGPYNFSFLAGKTKFVCLNTNALEFDYSIPVPDFGFITTEIEDDEREYDRTIVAMHVQPYADQFNNNVAQPFQHYLNMLRNLQFCLHGHTHRLSEEDIFGDGVIYYGCAAMKDKNYLFFTLTPDGYEYEVVYY
ncbi:MAG: metallophosphoesterase [Bacteroidales bacterium]